jgi:hypothetical protein
MFVVDSGATHIIKYTAMVEQYTGGEISLAVATAKCEQPAVEVLLKENTLGTNEEIYHSGLRMDLCYL